VNTVPIEQMIAIPVRVPMLVRFGGPCDVVYPPYWSKRNESTGQANELADRTICHQQEVQD
jgi:hypothetical protein